MRRAADGHDRDDDVQLLLKASAPRAARASAPRGGAPLHRIITHFSLAAEQRLLTALRAPAGRGLRPTGDGFSPLHRASSAAPRCTACVRCSARHAVRAAPQSLAAARAQGRRRERRGMGLRRAHPLRTAPARSSSGRTRSAQARHGDPRSLRARGRRFAAAASAQRAACMRAVRRHLATDQSPGRTPTQQAAPRHTDGRRGTAACLVGLVSHTSGTTAQAAGPAACGAARGSA